VRLSGELVELARPHARGQRLVAGRGIFRWRFRLGSGCLGKQIVASHDGKLAVLSRNANEGNSSVFHRDHRLSKESMTKPEAIMTKEFPNAPMTNGPAMLFIRAWGLVRHYGFVIRHFLTPLIGAE
jgi:hypothetical protein